MLKLLAVPLLPAEDAAAAVQMLRPAKCLAHHPEVTRAAASVHLYMESFWLLEHWPKSVLCAQSCSENKL
jgi:hypothetical protein